MRAWADIRIDAVWTRTGRGGGERGRRRRERGRSEGGRGEGGRSGSGRSSGAPMKSITTMEAKLCTGSNHRIEGRRRCAGASSLSHSSSDRDTDTAFQRSTSRPPVIVEAAESTLMQLEALAKGFTTRTGKHQHRLKTEVDPLLLALARSIHQETAVQPLPTPVAQPKLGYRPMVLYRRPQHVSHLLLQSWPLGMALSGA